MKKIHLQLLAIASIPFVFWFTPNIITKINYSKSMQEIELFDNGTVCAKEFGQQYYFRAFPKSENASGFWADNLCNALRNRSTFDNFSKNVSNRLEMWKYLFSSNP